MMDLSSKKVKTAFIVVSLIFVFSLNTSFVLSYANTTINLNSTSVPFSDKQMEFKNFQTEINKKQGFDGDYIPITNVSKDGSVFTAKDVLNVNHNFTIDLIYDSINDNFTDSFSISEISGYIPNILNYNITGITAKRHNYTIEDQNSHVQALSTNSNNTFAIAQAFNVIWDYAVFYGAEMNLGDAGVGSFQNDELEMFLVKAEDSTGYPNMSLIYSNDTNNPYNSVNQPTDGWDYYDFDDQVLTKGKYFIVANLSDSTTPTSPRDFIWRKNNYGIFSYDTYYMNSTGTWSSSPEDTDQTLFVDLLPSNHLGFVRNFTEPADITLKDNNLDVLTISSDISGTGVHSITSDTSVTISMNNSYSFYVTSQANSIYQAFNSTYDSYSIFWNITWQVNQSDYSPYFNLNRSTLLETPNDWNVLFQAWYNGTPFFSSLKANQGYLLLLNDSVLAYDIQLFTASPNYIQQLLLSDESVVTDTFTLGYWTTDAVNAFGHEGSTITSDVTLKDGETTGTLNFTVVNPDGLINPLKSSLPSNLTYLDTTEYSIGGITSSGPGIFSTSITFDPSVYGSEIPGLWSVFIFWENGTEIGIFSLSIKVQESTFSSYSWEIIPDSNDWTSNTADTLLRANGDSIDIEAYYFINSEPFFEDYGLSVSNASVRYSTSWGSFGDFDDAAPYYNTSVIASASAGIHTLVLTSYINETLDKTISINLEIFNVYTIEPVKTAIAINSTDEAIIEFRVINESDPLKGAIFPDEFTLTINDNPVSNLYYLYDTEGDLNIISIRIADYGVSSGTVNLGLNISKVNFKSGYLQDSVTFTFSVTVNPVDGNGEFPTKLIIAIVVPSVVIILSLVAYLLATSKSRKLEKPLIDVSDQSAVIQLFDSVLSMKKVLFIHAETSLPVFELNVGHEIEVDTALVSGFLAVVARMGKQIGGMETGDIRKLEYRNFVVNSASSDVYTLFLFSTEDIYPGILKKLFDLVMWFHYTFTIKGDWDGRIELFTDKRNLIQDKIAETLYLWVYFPLEFDAKKGSEIKKIEGLNPRVVNFLKKNKEVTISSILNNYPDIPLEETLTTIFKLVNKGVLIRRQFSSFAGKR